MATILDIATKARFLVDADTKSYTDANLLRELNEAYEWVVGYILGLDGMWQYDDTNFTDHPIATTTLVEGQYDYAFEDAFLEVLKIQVKDADGKEHFLDQIDRYEADQPLEEKYDVNGLPRKYDVQGGSVFIYPAADGGASVTLAAGLKIFYQRTADIYTSAQFTTGTKVPGFASPYHYILSFKAALTYALKYKPNRVAAIQSQILILSRDIKTHYARRNYDKRPKLTMSGNVNQAK